MIFSGTFKKSSTLALALASIVASSGVFAVEFNPYAPITGHHYRHGAHATREAHENMRNWRLQHAAGAVAPAAGIGMLSYGGGVNGIGVTSGTPKVYLIVYGTQWGTAGTNASGNMTVTGDALGAVPYLESLFKGLGTNGELWSGVMTQYCDGPLVASGATTCPSGAPHVGYPTGGAFAGIWYDNASASPAAATGAQLANEAIRAAAHFGNTTAASNRYAQYVILSPTGTTPDGFNTPSGTFCAWHDYTADQGVSSPYGDIAFTNMPYVADMKTSCGQNSVNAGTAGLLDGFSIVEGHEYAETVTDQNPAGGWTNHTGDATYNGQENADECSWINTGAQAASQNVVMATGTFAMQSTWSNDTGACNISHVIVTGAPPPSTVLSNGVAVTGISVAASASKTYTIVVPAGQSSLTIDTSGGTGDADLYVKLGSAPTTTSYLQKSDGSTATEHIAIANPAAGTYYVMVYGYAASSNISLVARYSASTGGNVLSNGVPVTGLAGAAGSSKVYTLVVPSGRTTLTFQTSGGTGDADLYVQLGSAPTTASYLKRSNGSTTAETVSIASPAAGTYYVMVSGYAAYSGVSLVGTD